ncbi:multiple C2 and transmembrane domain-containing protein 1-like isoform X2 [Gadus chalcogrammus]|uniref:multiple C2 and transmembrane domain-containing protein 1-like isoform X2 n=1 Tax=Gadus chalcogrammus TaxID=1042646 RepID=UPI0024C40F18|nr:multiple C2 and transmembrane domain-containing protein 1-like isoform X2 [Gadus chalcogrammus]
MDSLAQTRLLHDARSDMERAEEEKHANERLSHQNTIWKQFQAKAKPLLSPKVGIKDHGSKRERAMWAFRKKKSGDHYDLDRGMSCSQPDLVFSPADGDARDPRLCGKIELNSGQLCATEERLQAAAKESCGGSGSHSPWKPGRVRPCEPSHHKSSSLGSACLERLIEASVSSGGEALSTRKARAMGASAPLAANPDQEAPSPGMHTLDVELRRGHNLAARDRGGTSDPYVKFKLSGKEVFRSKIINKNLNPVWDERTTLILDGLSEPLYIKVFDYDFGLQDDFMGSAYLPLDSLEQQRTVVVTLELKDSHYPDQDLGSLELSVTLGPKDSPVEEPKDCKTMLLRRSWKRSTKQQSMRLSEVHRKSQLWRGIVSIALIEGRDLIPMDPNGLSDPYVKFRLGSQKYRSKTISKTLSPQWREQFDLHLYEETAGVLEISVWDKDTGRRDDFIGRCQLDLSTLAPERTHRLELSLENVPGSLVLLVTLTASLHVSIAEMSVTPLDDPQERAHIAQHYGFLRSFSNMRDVGIVMIKVIRAEGLMAADVTGKSDPFCVVELNNDRLQTHTVYKNLNPEWNKVFTFNVKDIHAVLEVTVLDEDRDRSADFLGKVSIPLLYVRNGVQRGYVLKNKHLTGPKKGVVYLEIDVIFNTVKAALKTIVPAENKYIEEDPKVSKYLLQQNFNRVKRCIMVLINVGSYINSCFEWESAQRSILSFLVFVLVVWNFELYMLPLLLLMLLVWNYIFCLRETTDTSMEAMFDWEEEEEEEKDCERKGFLDKLYAIQDVFLSVQTALDEVASYGERIKNTANWTVPFLSWLAVTVLCVAMVLLYFLPLRYLVLAWGVNKFTKKLRNPYLIDNNELVDFLSRVPSDVQVVQYRELKVDPGQSPNKRKRTNPG